MPPERIDHDNLTLKGSQFLTGDCDPFRVGVYLTMASGGVESGGVATGY